MAELREQEKSIKNNTLYMRNAPRQGEQVFSVIPPFAITALMTKGQGVVKNPDQFWTCSTLWKAEQTAKYEELVIKLLEEKKIYCVGRINKQLLIEFSKEGIRHLEEMVRKFEWNTNITW
jgi:glutamate mutase epsilon subunit